MNRLNFCGYICAIIIFLLETSSVQSELTPPYFNLAEGRQISATATCGVGTDGPELYCKLVGANTEHDNNQHQYELIQGQVNEHNFAIFYSNHKMGNGLNSRTFDFLPYSES